MANVIIKDKAVKKALLKMSQALSPDKSKKLLSILGSLVKVNILKRTASGIDVDNKFFKPYSDRYKLFRAAKGRPTDKVDLFFKGHMLGSMSVKTDSDKSVVFFADKTQAGKAAGHTFGMNNLPERNFFAISASDITDIEKEIDNFITAEMR